MRSAEESVDLAGKALYEHLERMPLGAIKMRKSVSGAALYDIEVWFYEKFVGAAKVLPDELYRQDVRVSGWTVPIEQLTALRKACFAGGRWVKRAALLLVTADEHILMVDMLTVGKKFHDYPKTEDGAAVIIPYADLVALT